MWLIDSSVEERNVEGQNTAINSRVELISYSALFCLDCRGITKRETGQNKGRVIGETVDCGSNAKNSRTAYEGES